MKQKLNSFLFAVMLLIGASASGLAQDTLSYSDVATNGEPETAELTVIHGISGLPAPVDVYANGGFLFSFDFGESRGPLDLPPDTYNIEVKLAGQTVLAASPTLEAGKSYTAVANFVYNDGDTPGITISLFENRTSPAAFLQGRLNLYHLADAPTVDIELRRGVRHFTYFYTKALDLSNVATGPGQFSVDVRRGLYSARFYPVGSFDAVASAGPVYFKRESGYNVFAIGSIFDGTFRVFIQKYDLAK